MSSKRYLNTKYMILISVVTILLITTIIILVQRHIDGEKQDYCYEINAMIKDYDFAIGKIIDSKIYLYDDSDNVIETIDFPQYDKHIKILYIRNNYSIIYFVTSGFVDDEEGIAFINDETNKIFDGIASFERVGGNSYKYES